MRSFVFVRRLVVLTTGLGLAVVSSEAARTHVVQRGETLTSIASDFDVDVGALARANKLRDRDLLVRGQKLQIPATAATFVMHRVTRGESLARIAKSYHTTVADIRAHNDLDDPDHIVPGQTLRIPVSGGPAGDHSARARAADHTGPDRVLPKSVQAQIDKARVAPGKWKYIVIHHSATDEGSGKNMDRYHREERHMENGLAYHFVIGNGHGMGDGEIFVGARWTKQLPGGHLAIEALNEISLGICLVGDFEHKAPTRRQLDSLEALIRALERRTGLEVSAVTTHRLIHPHHTQCPGRLFPLDAFLARLRQP
jgi:LysM repeat protein